MKGGVKPIQLLLCGTNVRMRKFLTSLVLRLAPKPKPSGFLGLWNLNLYHMLFFLKSVSHLYYNINRNSGFTKFHLKIWLSFFKATSYFKELGETTLNNSKFSNSGQLGSRIIFSKVCFSETKPKPEFYKKKINMTGNFQFIFSSCSPGILRKAVARRFIQRSKQ